MIIIPNHKTHDKVGLICTPLVIATGSLLNLSLDMTVLLTGAYLFSTYFITPDLDIDSAPYYRWGMFRIFWYPYKTVIKHRSMLSHSGPISGTIRFIYIAAIITIITTLCGYPILLQWLPYYGILWLSIVFVDCIHTLLDMIWR